MSERPDKLVEALRNALRDNERLRRAAAEAANPVNPTAPANPAPEPIAVIGAACRFSGGVSSPEQLWRLVDTGTDTVGPPPPERTGSATVLGAFLDEPGAFDAGFFGISPREALAMDPQQRLVLECSWEALERAGIDPIGLARTDTGVFVGSSMQDYGGNTFGAAELEGLLATGNAAAVLSGRVSYVLGLEGPALTVDTACSSSLVTLHLARQSLLRGECSLALAGGATVMATDLMFAEFGRQGGLAPDGRCKAFGDDADGTGWGEGAGMLVLEKLSDARRLGHPVLVVVRGSAVNSDGASNGLTAPNGPSQQRVIRAALADAGLTAAEVDVVEAHGTGTELGDPIEAQALLATYGQDRATPLLLGSVKSNIGHTQAAAGVAGVLKMIEALRHRRVPPTLHAQRPSTRVDWRAGAVELASGQPWPHAGRPGRAGVSSFGVSGTNAHVILEEAVPAPDPGALPSAPVATPVVATPVVTAPVAVAWPLSARGAGGLRRQAARLAPEVAGLHPADVGHTLSTRAGLEERAVLVGADATALTEALVALATDEPGPDVVLGTARPGGPGRTVFVFPGQGAQWTGMGRALYDESPVFAEALRDCAAALAKYVDWDLLEVLADERALRGADVLQPASWAVMVALARLWQSHGVTPAAVLGHSQGEIAAACVAGVLDLVSGAKVVVSRARLIARSLSGHGAMASVAEPAQRIRERLAGRGDDREVSVAAVNGPAATTVSGPRAQLRALVDECVAEDVRAKLLPVDYASHSAQVDALRTDLLAELAELAPEPGGPAFFSTVTGEVLDGTRLDAEYWYRNLREPVGFAPAVQALAGRGYGCFLEVSTHPVLLAGTSDTLTEAGAAHAVATGTLRRDDGGLSRFLRSLGEVWAHGVVVDWAPAFGPARRVELPTYAFDHRHYWATPPAPETGPAPGAAFWSAVEHTDPVALSGLLDTDQDAVAGLLPALSTWWQAERAASGGAPGWRYRVHWRPVDVPRAPAPAALLVVLPEQPEPGARAVLAALRTVAEVRTVTVPTDTDRAALAGQLSSGDTLCTAGAVVSLLAGAPGWATPGVAHAWRLTRLLVQALGDLESDLPLWCLTTEAAGPEAAAESRSDSTGSDSTGSGGAARPEQTALWALGLVAGLERPHQKVVLADLPAEPGEDCVRTLLGLLCATSPEDQVVLRGRRVLGRRIVRANARPVPAEGGNARRPGDGAVLVTGGTGGLGALLARRLARRGETDIVLAGRRGVLPDGLELPGVRAVVCDVTDADSVAALRAELLAEDTRVRAVYHLAGVVSGVPIESSDDAEWAAVCGPKVAGVRHLEQVFGADAGEFVLFSSNAGVWGSAGQAAYATANRYLDAFAAARRRAGRHALAIAWGAWGEVGMAAGPAGTDLTRLGLKPMAPDAALDVLEQALDTDETTLSVADVDWPRFAGAYAAARARPLLDGIPEAVVDEPAAAHDQAAALHGELATLTHTEQHELLRQLVTAKAGAILGYRRGETLDPVKAFRDLGFDSLTAVELRNSLVRGTGVTLPTTVVFDHPNATALAEHLHRLLVGGTGPETLHADLDRLERSMADLDTTPDVLNQLALRLHRIANTLVTEPATGPGEHTVTDVDTADPDELLAIIQGEFKS